VDLAERTLSSLADQRLDDVTMARVARWQATILFHARGRCREAVDLLERRSKQLSGAPLGELRAHLLALRSFLGQADVVLTDGPALVEELSGPVVLEALQGLARAHLQAGAPTASLRVLDRHAAVAADLRPHVPATSQEQADAVLLESLVALGDLTTAGEALRERLPVGTRTSLPWLPMAAARLHLDAGQPRAARELVAVPRAAVGSQEPLHTAPIMQGLAAQADVRLGSSGDATALAEVAADSLPTLQGALRWRLAASLADVWIELGMDARAASAVTESIAEARAAGARLHEAELLFAAGRAGDDVTPRLDELAAAIDGPLWSLRARHVRAMRGPGNDEERDALASAYTSLGQRWLGDLASADR
jgi:hypothetical protein